MLQGCPQKDKYVVNMCLLATISSYLIDNYPLKDNISNYDIVEKFITKTKFRRMGNDIRGGIKYLIRLAKTDKKPSVSKLNKWSKLFNRWQQKLTQINLDRYYDDRCDRDVIKSLGVACFYILDTLYHIFLKFVSKDHKCEWCGFDFSRSWEELLDLTGRVNTLCAYLYIRLAQSYFLGESHSKEFIESVCSELDVIVKKEINNLIALEYIS